MSQVQTEQKRIFSLLNLLPCDVREKLESHMRDFVFLKKQVLLREGFMPTGLFIIRKGKVKIFRISDTSREIITRISGEGEMIGYSALIQKSEYQFWAAAIEKTELSFLPQKYFYELIESYPEFSMSLMQEFARQYDEAMDKMVDMLSDHVRKRTAKALLSLVQTHGMEEDGKTIKISLSRQDLAHMLATNTETLVRTLTDLRNENVIELKRKKIVVADSDKLNHIAYY